MHITAKSHIYILMCICSILGGVIVFETCEAEHED